MDARNCDLLLEWLRKVHGDSRADIAPEITAATRATARRGIN
jgi:hypothetical protein